MVEKHVNDCRFISVLIVIAVDCLNFSGITILPASDFDELSETNLLSGQARYVAYDLMTDDDINFIFKMNADLAYHSVEKNTYFYCVDNIAWFMEQKWGIFFAPFHPLVWYTILLFSLLISVFNVFVKQHEMQLYRIIKIFLDSINYTFLFNGYLSHHLKNNRVLLSFIALNIVILVNVYFGIVTSDFLVMPSGQKFFDLKNLYVNGFRHMVNTLYKQVGQIITNAEERFNAKDWTNFTSPYKSDKNGNQYYVLGNFTYHSPSQYEAMCRLKAFEMFEVLQEVLNIKANEKFFDTNDGSIRCFLFHQKDKQTKRLLFVSFHFWKSELQLVGTYLQQSGIHRYWELVENWQRLYNEFQKGNKEGVSFGNKEYSPIPLQSHIQMIFYILICGLLVTGIVLLYEFVVYDDMRQVKRFGKKVMKKGRVLTMRMVNGVYYYYRKIRNLIRHSNYLLKKCSITKCRFLSCTRLPGHTKPLAVGARKRIPLRNRRQENNKKIQQNYVIWS